MILNNTPDLPIQSSMQEMFSDIALHAAQSDQEGYFPEKEFDLIKQSGLLTITLPGQPLCFHEKQTRELLQLLKSVGKASLPVGRIYEGHINALYLIFLFGNEQQKQQLYANASENLFGVWNTQDSEGLEIHDLRNGRYRLKGCKTFCSGGAWIGQPLLTGKLISPTKKGWQMCVIPAGKVQEIKSDSSFWKPLGMRASASFKMDFTGIELENDDLIGKPDDYYRQPYFGSGALRFAAVQLGGAEAFLEEMHRFLRAAERTDDPFQRTRAAEISMLVETGNLWINQAALHHDQWLSLPDTSDKLLAYVNMTRTVIEDVCLRTMQLAERSVGARGLMRPGVMERLHRDLTTYLRQPAPDVVQIMAGKYVLDQPKTAALWD